LEIGVAAVLVLGAMALGRFALFGAPAVLVGRENAAHSTAWRLAALSTSALAALVAWRLSVGSSDRTDGGLLGPVVLYGAAGLFGVGALLAISGIQVSASLFIHGLGMVGPVFAAWQLAARRRRLAARRRQIDASGREA